jgi:hypothetical protein
MSSNFFARYIKQMQNSTDINKNKILMMFSIGINGYRCLIVCG